MTPFKFIKFIKRTFVRSFKNTEKLAEFVQMIDIDKDGYIDPIDLEYFLKRFPLVANQQSVASPAELITQTN